MQFTHRTLLAAVTLLGIPMLLPGPAAAPSGMGGAWNPPGGSACVKTAKAIKKAAILEAKADYELRKAVILNDTGVNQHDALEEAKDERDEAIDLAKDQYDARLDVCELLGSGPYDPAIDPAEFSPDVTNPYFPLVVGRTLRYETVTAEGLECDEVTTLSETVEIAGVTCRAVHDVVTLDGELIEDTLDWFAQDVLGNVWYFGESAKNYEDGFLDNLDGSWRTGKDGARPGIVMKAMPMSGDAYRQEFLPNEAEDIAKVLSIDENVSVPYGMFMNCVHTQDFSPLEPDLLETKTYAVGLGVVQEVDMETGEVTELVQVIGP